MSKAYQRAYGASMQIAREKAGITQAELAEAVGRSKSWVVDIERGKSLPTLELVVPLQQAVDAPARVVSEWAMAKIPVWAHELLDARWPEWFLEAATDVAREAQEGRHVR